MSIHRVLARLKETSALTNTDGIFTVFWTGKDSGEGDERMDYNAIVRAKSINEARSKIKKALGLKKTSDAGVMSVADLQEFGITQADIKEMDKRGYYIYDSGT